jgi:hypothetical protein
MKPFNYFCPGKGVFLDRNYSNNRLAVMEYKVVVALYNLFDHLGKIVFGAV